MIRKLLAGVVLTVGLLGIAGSTHAEYMPGKILEFSEGTPGLFCNVESKGVCVIAQNEEDCKKLGGEKVDSCEAPKDTEGKE